MNDDRNKLSLDPEYDLELGIGIRIGVRVCQDDRHLRCLDIRAPIRLVLQHWALDEQHSIPFEREPLDLVGDNDDLGIRVLWIRMQLVDQLENSSLGGKIDQDDVILCECIPHTQLLPYRKVRNEIDRHA